MTAWRAYGDGHWRELVTCGSIWVAALVLTSARQHAASLNFAEEEALTGAALVEQRDYAAARNAYLNAIRDDPKSALGWNGLGIIDLNEQNLVDAETHFRAALAIEPSFAAGHEHLAVVLQRKGEVDAAIKEYKSAVELRPDLSGAESGLADALMAAGRPEQALGYYRQIQQHQNQPNARLLLAMARAEGQIGHPTSAMELAKQATEIEPTNGDAWLVLSLCQRLTDDLSGAEQSLDRAASLLGSREDIMLAKAMVYRAQRRGREADALLQDVLRKNPASAEARTLYLEFAREDGRLGDASAFLRVLQDRR
jgi:tetratricopeptide (TPR) repeat protein